MASASSLLAPLHWKSLWSKMAGGHEHSSWAYASYLASFVLVDAATPSRWNSSCGLANTFSPFTSASGWAASGFALDDTGNMYSLNFFPSYLSISSVQWTEHHLQWQRSMLQHQWQWQWRVVSGEKRPHVVKKFINLSTSCLPRIIYVQQ